MEGAEEQKSANTSLHMEWTVREVFVHSIVYREEIIKKSMNQRVQERKLIVNLPFHQEKRKSGKR